jgi:oligoendopeptidase F
MEDAQILADRFDIDIQDPDFWKGSLQIITSDIERFENLVDQLNADPTER